MKCFNCKTKKSKSLWNFKNYGFCSNECVYEFIEKNKEIKPELIERLNDNEERIYALESIGYEQNNKYLNAFLHALKGKLIIPEKAGKLLRKVISLDDECEQYLCASDINEKQAKNFTRIRLIRGFKK